VDQRGLGCGPCGARWRLLENRGQRARSSCDCERFSSPRSQAGDAERLVESEGNVSMEAVHYDRKLMDHRRDGRKLMTSDGRFPP